MRVLIIEDEYELAYEIKEFLLKEKYNCDIAVSGKEAFDFLVANPYDFILLDIGLPDYNGLDLMNEAKKILPDSFYIIITARGEIEDKIKGLNLGADDYMAKPFSLLEMLSRMQAILRRKSGYNSSEVRFGDFVLDLNKKSLFFKSKLIDLTLKEYKLLSYLVLNRNRILDRLQLTEHVWGDFFEDDYDSNYIDVHIKNIRKKLMAFDESKWIKTVRGLGYKFEME